MVAPSTTCASPLSAAPPGRRQVHSIPKPVLNADLLACSRVCNPWRSGKSSTSRMYLSGSVSVSGILGCCSLSGQAVAHVCCRSLFLPRC